MPNRFLHLPRYLRSTVTIRVLPPDERCHAARTSVDPKSRKLLTARRLTRRTTAGMAVATQLRVQDTPAPTQSEPFHLWQRAMQAAETRMILIVGADAAMMEWAALSLFRAGHIPVLGQWFLPLVTSDTENASGGDDLVGDRLLGRCDAVLRIEGPAPNADALVHTARARGLRIYDNLDDAIAG